MTRVADFAQFQAIFDPLFPVRQRCGLIDPGTFCAAEEPETIIVLMKVTDLARAREYWHSQILAQGPKRPG